MNDALEYLLTSYPQLYVQQRKELVEILVDWETANRYAIMAPNQQDIGFVAERKGGLGAALLRWFLRSHRALEIDVFNMARQPILHLARPFFFFFSDLEVSTPEGHRLGSLHRRFGILHKRYDLKDASGQVFASISSPIWRLWQFPIVNAGGQKLASIAKRWGGALREIFTDADTYQIDFGARGWTTQQRAVILAAAISIDFDFFENNQGASSIFGMFTGD